MGSGVWGEIAGRTVLDFGCGPGLEALEMVQHGATRVVSVDIRDEWLDLARARASEAGVSGSCTFARGWSLNKMTLERFERAVEASPLRFDGFDAVPIRRLKRFANRLTREFTTSVVRCRLVAREA
jgi:SAM-dependent methyltransferase